MYSSEMDENDGYRSRYVSYTLLASPMPSVFRDEALVKRFGLPRGVAGRRAGLNWIKAHTKYV